MWNTYACIHLGVQEACLRSTHALSEVRGTTSLLSPEATMVSTPTVATVGIASAAYPAKPVHFNAESGNSLANITAAHQVCTRLVWEFLGRDLIRMPTCHVRRSTRYQTRIT